MWAGLLVAAFSFPLLFIASLALGHFSSTSSGYENLIDSIFLVCGYFLALNGAFKLRNFLKMGKMRQLYPIAQTSKLYQLTRTKAVAYSVLGVLLFAYPFIYYTFHDRKLLPDGEPANHNVVDDILGNRKPPAEPESIIFPNK